MKNLPKSEIKNELENSHLNFGTDGWHGKIAEDYTFDFVICHCGLKKEEEEFG